MKRLVLSVLALGLAAFLAADAFAHGRRGSCGGCESSCGSATDCCTVVAAPAPEIKYEERKVTVHKCVTKEKEIEVDVCRTISKEVPYTYTVMVQKMEQEKRMQTCYKTVTKEVPTTYTVMVQKMEQEKRMQTCYKTVTKEVPYTYTVMVPYTEQIKQTRTVCRMVTETVQVQVPVCRVVRVPVKDACGNCCGYTCQTVTETQVCNRTVCKPVYENQEVLVNVTKCRPEERKGVRTVCETVAENREVLVNVCRYIPEERKGTKLVCETVAENREILVNVCRYVPEERKGTKLVCENVTTKEKRKVLYTEMVAEVVIQKVAVGGTCDAGCAPASTCCDSGHHRGGLFRGRLCGRGCN